MEVKVIDPGQAEDFDRWFSVVRESGADLWPDHPGWQHQELRQAALEVGGPERRALLAASDAGAAVGSAWVELPVADNLHLATFELHTHPARRRLGVGSALLDAVESLAAAEGRVVVVGYHDEPARWAGRSPGRAFALAHRYLLAQVEVRRDLALPVAAGLLEDLEASCSEAAQGYEVVTWHDRCPDDLAADRAELAAHMSTDAPQGEVAMGGEAWDVERLRRHEELAERQGRRLVSSGARERSSGRLVACTEIQVSSGAPERAYQWDTVVLPGHRGHRLGTLVKVANTRALQAASPATTVVTTTNAEDNRYMIAVNEALGCRVTGLHLAWQKRLAA